nr:type II toxin-antitoxin system Phd/YefM family antitoxin [uncultured Halomonas sp.]
MEWQLQTAKSKFSHLVETASKQGPQIITVRGKRQVVVMSVDEYESLTRRQSEDTFVEFLRNSPLADVELDLERACDEGREVIL